MNNIMLDLETMGKKSNAAIISIGAARFDFDSGIKDTFDCIVDLQSCLDMEFSVDSSTIMWWLSQEKSAKTEFQKIGIHIIDALHSFAGWAGENVILWGNGVAFDNVILGNAYQKCDIEKPWKYYNDRCYRTIKNIYFEIKHTRKNTKHIAVNDAIYQAEHLIKIFRLKKM